jgi:hypothetical protein
MPHWLKELTRWRRRATCPVISSARAVKNGLTSRLVCTNWLRSALREEYSRNSTEKTAVKRAGDSYINRSTQTASNGTLDMPPRSRLSGWCSCSAVSMPRMLSTNWEPPGTTLATLEESATPWSSTPLTPFKPVVAASMPLFMPGTCSSVLTVVAAANFAASPAALSASPKAPLPRLL